MQMAYIIDRFLSSKQSKEIDFSACDINTLRAIATGCRDKMFTWHSYETLMENSRVGSKTTTAKCLRKLVALGIIRIQKRFKTSNVYYFEKAFIDNIVQNIINVVHKWTGNTKAFIKKQKHRFNNYVHKSKTGELKCTVPWFKPNKQSSTADKDLAKKHLDEIRAIVGLK